MADRYDDIRARAEKSLFPHAERRENRERLARADVPWLLDRIDAVRELHRPENRYHDGSGEFSMDTAQQVVDEYEIPVEDVQRFEVCRHCAYLETWASSEASVDYDYRESLWPCATSRAVDGAVPGDPAGTAHEEETADGT